MELPSNISIDLYSIYSVTKNGSEELLEAGTKPAF